MGVMDTLNRLDQKVLPRLARGLRRMTWLTRRRRFSPLAVTAVVLAAAVVATIVGSMIQPSNGNGGAHSTIRVGVSEGDTISTYIEQSRSELSRLTEESPERHLYALVSFAAYVPPGRLAAIASVVPGGLSTIAAYARVPVPRRQTELIWLSASRLPDDLVASMVEVADRKDRDAVAYDQLAQRAVGDALRSLYESNAALARAEAAGYRGLCSCVFALVVRATPVALTSLAAQRDVRVVDSAPELVQLDRAVFAPPLPEQTGTVGPPPDDELASPAPRTATGQSGP